MIAALQRIRGEERGSAVVEFTLVMPLALILMLAVLQLALAMHVRSTVIAAAAEGARVAAMLGSDLTAGAERTRAVLASSMAGTGVRDVTAQRTMRDGLATVTVSVTAELPLVGFFGPTTVDFTGTALDEHW